MQRGIAGVGSVGRQQLPFGVERELSDVGAAILEPMRGANALAEYITSY
jgi:hypothetical protein